VTDDTAPASAPVPAPVARRSSPWRSAARPAGEGMAAVPVEARPFQGHRAGIVTKVAANTIDLIVIVVVVAALYLGYAAFLFLLNPRSFSFPAPRFGLLLLLGGAIMTGYFWIAWATVGRTYGDHVLGLRVVGWRGERMRWVPALLRAVFCVVFMLGLFWTVISRQNRSIQDVVLRTSVIYDWEVHTGGLRRDEVADEVPETAQPGPVGNPENHP
jgi:uncharacterized RDD family membrane protein YckC